MKRSLAFLGAGIGLHALLVHWTGPWWTPNLTLIGLLWAVARSPQWWWLLSGLAGLFMLSWSVRFPHGILLTAFLLGGLVRWLAARWDVTDPRVQTALALVTCGLLTGGALWTEALWSWPLAGAAAGHIALTGAAAHWLRRLG